MTSDPLPNQCYVRDPADIEQVSWFHDAWLEPEAIICDIGAGTVECAFDQDVRDLPEGLDLPPAASPASALARFAHAGALRRLRLVVARVQRLWCEDERGNRHHPAHMDRLEFDAEAGILTITAVIGPSIRMQVESIDVAVGARAAGADHPVAGSVEEDRGARRLYASEGDTPEVVGWLARRKGA